jgi:hypothetical protein
VRRTNGRMRASASRTITGETSDCMVFILVRGEDAPVSPGPAGPALPSHDKQRPTGASAAVQGDRPGAALGDHPTLPRRLQFECAPLAEPPQATLVFLVKSG